MINLTRINRVPLVLNSDLIEHIETTPDTVVTLSTGQKIRVMESSEQIVERIVEFRRSLSAGNGCKVHEVRNVEEPELAVASRREKGDGFEETN